jgi:hypothetical protein|tara:strand:+ start:219 stop:1163 length:945 start_codon:yes stop_codon:yes gene_type:complete
MSNRFPLIADSSAKQIKELASGDTLDLAGNNVSGAGVVTATTFSGNLSGNVTGTVQTAAQPNITSLGALTSVNVSGAATVSGNLTIQGTQTLINSADVNIADKLVGIGSTSSPTDATCDGAGIKLYGTTDKTFTWERDTGCFETSEPSKFKGIIETVAVAATSNTPAGRLIVTCDLAQASTFTHAMAGGAGGQVGIVSFKNMPADTGVQNGTTATIIFTQNSTTPQSGVGNTQFPAGIGTNISIAGFNDGTLLTGISTTAKVGSGNTVFLSNVASDDDFVSFFIHYNGGGNTTANSYQVYAIKSEKFREPGLTV